MAQGFTPGIASVDAAMADHGLDPNLNVALLTEPSQ
jgi:hypothetical protein